ncbi:MULTISPECIES: hypothetical protein [Parachlamydia]|uniref:hypothetical protein n=1 Tax=Parachlamydia TaxID=83551 RepID=UPI0001C17344|nr:hypothetical protein [Parachlamydia acanthamoebae]EFB40093.1 hypothetical protein pah_c268o006 [Parachlamydia acanthamoebae str. Hall's coccus]
MLLSYNGPAPFEYFDGTKQKIREINQKYRLSQDLFIQELDQHFIEGKDVKLIFDPNHPEDINI